MISERGNSKRTRFDHFLRRRDPIVYGTGGGERNTLADESEKMANKAG